MKLIGFVCNVEMGIEDPSCASSDPYEAVYEGDAYKIYEDEKGCKWIEIQGNKWICNNEKVYSKTEWGNAHWRNIHFPSDDEM